MEVRKHDSAFPAPAGAMRVAPALLHYLSRLASLRSESGAVPPHSKNFSTICVYQCSSVDISGFCSSVVLFELRVASINATGIMAA